MATLRYVLEPYKPGGANRYVCPSCGRKKCFTRYVDTTTGEYLDDDCGKCDHTSSCNYHLPPKEFFKQNPEARHNRHNTHETQPFDKPQHKLPVLYIDQKHIDAFHSQKSQFMHWLIARFGNTPAVQDAYERYHLGATRTGGVIFWQTDIDNRTRTGKVMHYWADGHRVKDAEDYALMLHQPFTDRSPQPLYYIHNRMKRKGMIPDGHRVVQCLFGEHLLRQQPDADVCVVESEKSAIVCHILYPQFVWLATGGCNLLTNEMLAPLRDRNLIIYPDSGKLQCWNAIMQRLPDYNYRIVKDLEHYPQNTDIVDLLLS